MMKPRIVAIGLNLHGGGLTRVMRAILGRLSADYDIHYFGIGYTGPEIREDGVRIYPTNREGGDALGTIQAGAFIRRVKPEIVLLLHNIWIFANFAEAFRPMRKISHFVGYVPVDWGMTNEAPAQSFEFLDRVAVYTEWARDQVKDAFRRLRESGKPGPFPAVEVVGHGVDRSSFFPVPALEKGGFRREHRAGAKSRVFPELPDPCDSFIVLNANRQDVRKRIDLTIAGFARFAREKPAHVRLCLHHPLMDEEERKSVHRWCDEYGIRDRVLLNPLDPSGTPVGDDDLNWLYNACDVGINTSMGEGWGLVSFEHAAAGAAQIVPRHSGCAELWDGGAAEFLEVAERKLAPGAEFEMEVVSPDGVAESLEKLYRDPDLLAGLAARSFHRACRPEFDWACIAKEWDEIFRGLIAASG